MPGMRLSFKCPCGFEKSNVMVGAAEDGHYYLVSICLQCRTLFSVWTTAGEGHKTKPCRKCGAITMTITEPGAWGPPSLQNIFPDIEPWLVQDQIAESLESQREDIAQAKSIRILCPRCGKYSVRWECTMLWD